MGQRHEIEGDALAVAGRQVGNGPERGGHARTLAIQAWVLKRLCDAQFHRRH
jgi:hypothetical protein